MNMDIKNMKRVLTIVLGVVAVAACATKENQTSFPELGVKKESCVLDCTPGKYEIEVLSDGEFNAFIKEGDWLYFENSQSKECVGQGDMCLTLVYDLNRGLERHAVVEISRKGKSVEVSLIQEGILSSDIAFSCNGLEVDENGGDMHVNISSVYNFEDLVIKVRYHDAEGWIGNIKKENNSLTFNVLANQTDKNRVADILVCFKNDSSIGDRLQVAQYGIGCQPIEKTFQEVKASLLTEGEMMIEDNWALSAVAIGDDLEGNGGENANISPIIQDLSLSERTAYIQNNDASSGMKILFEKGENIIERYDAVKILLKGTTLVRKGGGKDDPVRYELTGVTAGNIASATRASETCIPDKTKYISQLTDEDVYTFVTLADCEIPVRKGPFVPIDLRLSSVMHSYPMIMRDVLGNNIFLMTNLTASWQRDGNVMPQGSGNVSGVIVHETCDNFEWDSDEMTRQTSKGVGGDYVTGIGNIGAYQIRPFSRKDIEVEDSFDKGFSGLIMEIRYYNKDNDEIIKNVDGNTIYSTYPPVQNPIHDPEIRGILQVMEGNPAKQAGIAVWRDWTHLGPMSNGLITDTQKGNGVHDANGKPVEWAPSSNVPTTGLLLNASGWYAGSNWGPSKYWIATFSTAATASSPALDSSNFPLSVQFGTVSGLGQNVGAPRYWCVEYCTSDDNEWVEAGKYTVPDFPILSYRKSWQCPGPKYVSVTLPEDPGMLNNPNVRIRLRPLSSVAGSSESYDGAKVVNGRQTELNYFAVRFNK